MLKDTFGVSFQKIAFSLTRFQHSASLIGQSRVWLDLLRVPDCCDVFGGWPQELQQPG